MSKPYSEEFNKECISIANWWCEHAIDKENGGFYGRVAHNNRADSSAPKCIIMHARILWFFGELVRYQPEPQYKAAADRAYEYLKDYFVDAEHGGVYWMLDAQGAVLDDRKHSYAQAFAIYGLSAYFLSSHNIEALQLASEIFNALQTNCRDEKHGGYFEAFARNWSAMDDVRLSKKDANSPKSMNTHLHILEALSEYCLALKTARQISVSATSALYECLSVYCRYIVNESNGHVRMFLDEQWGDQSTHYSYGHDIESSWLILKATEVLRQQGITDSLEHFDRCAENIARKVFAEGLKPNGSMLDEVECATGQSVNSAWWVQLEAMLGFTYMWSRGESDAYLKAALKIWSYVKNHYLDTEFGEWYWFSKYDQPPVESDYKVGEWKGPYHNGRAMMLMAKLLHNMELQTAPEALAN